MTAAALAAALPVPTTDKATIEQLILKAVGSRRAFTEVLEDLDEEHADDVIARDVLWRMINERTIELTADGHLVMLAE